MNFYGHSVVAAWTNPAPRFVFGSMLPDLTNLSRIRLHSVDDDEVAAGIAWHHHCDRAFHGLPFFVSTMRMSAERLRRAGVAKGPALGTAHIAFEFVLDIVLAAAGHGAETYVAALTAGGSADLADRMRWRKPEGPTRFAELHQRMTAWGPPTGDEGPAVLAERIRRTLAPRRLLALADSDIKPITGEIDCLFGELNRHLESLLTDLRRAL